jgi:uncharacterized protein YceK
MLRRCLAAAVIAGLTGPLGGCGSVIGRANGYPGIYPGLQQDGAFLGVTGANEPYNPSAAATFICYTTIICVPLTLLSVPVDAAIDTVLLPIDLTSTTEP